jgi:negative regulator of flagellin synthesis FlgM
VKVDNSIKPVPGVTPAEGATRSPGGAAGGGQVGQRSGVGAPSDNNFSPELKALAQGLATSEVIDQARVDAIKQAISEGRLKINPEVIADRLLDATRELLQNAKGRP